MKSASDWRATLQVPQEGKVRIFRIQDGRQPHGGVKVQKEKEKEKENGSPIKWKVVT